MYFNSSCCRRFTSTQVTVMFSFFTLSVLVPVSLAIRDSGYKTAYACEGSQLKLSCDAGLKINLIRANFGRFSISICNDHGNLDWSVNCMSRRSFRVMQEACANRKSCTLPASSGYFSDPCPGTSKYLEAHYQCLPDSYLKFTDRDQRRPHRKQHSELEHSESDNSTPPTANTLPVVIGDSQSQTNTSHDFTKLSDSDETFSDKEESRAELPSPQTLPESPVIITITSEEKAIFVKHPYPRKLHSNENEMSSTSTESPQNNRPLDSSNIPPVNNAMQAAAVETKASMSVPPAQPSPSTSLLSNHCPPTYSGGLYWNWTRAGDMSFLPCPSGAKGNVRWFCTPTTEVPEWIPSHRPDFSDCSSLWVTSIVDRINKGDSFVNLANELADITRVEEDNPSRNFFGGDLIRVTDIINQLVIRMEEAFELFSDDRQKNQLAKELLQSIQDTASNMLEESNNEAWFELTPMERKGAASSLMYGLERNVLLLSETKNIPSDFIRAHNNIYISINVRESGGLTSSSNGHRQGLELPVILSDGLNDETNLDRNYEHFPSNSVYLLPQTVVDFSKHGLTKIVLLIFKKLDRLLMPDYEFSVGGNENTAFSAQTILNSEIVTVLVGKDRFNTVSLEGSGILINFKHKQPAGYNLTNPRCVYWNANQRNWDSGGCSVKKTDSMHKICECTHIGSFGLLMDLSDTLDNQYKFTTNKKTVDNWNSVIAVGCALALICFGMTLITLLVLISRNKEMKPSTRTELEVKKNLTICLIVIEALFLFGVNQTDSRFICGFVAALLHNTFLAMFIWLFFDGFTLYLALISDKDNEPSQLHPAIPGFSLCRKRRPSKWYFILAYCTPLMILTTSLIFDSSSYGTDANCWLHSNNHFLLLFGPMIAILSANVLFLAITVCIICRNCMTALFPKKANIHNLRSAMSANQQGSTETFAKFNRLKNRMRESALLLVVVSLTWSLGVIHLNQKDTSSSTSFGTSHDYYNDDALFKHATYTFAILNPIQAILVFVLQCPHLKAIFHLNRYSSANTRVP